MTELTFGPPKFFCPVCIRWPWGFMGGPSGYEEVEENGANQGPVILDARKDDDESIS